MLEITTIKTIEYHGHVIRECEDFFRCKVILVDNDADAIEESPVKKKENEWEYASITDAKRIIDGKRPNRVPWYVLGVPEIAAKYFTRFDK